MYAKITTAQDNVMIIAVKQGQHYKHKGELNEFCWGWVV